MSAAAGVPCQVFSCLGRRYIQCEACQRSLLERRFPSKVLASVQWHVKHPDQPRGETIWSCKECRAQEVANRERIEAFLRIRLPDGAGTPPG